MTERAPISSFETRLTRRLDAYSNIPVRRVDANVAAVLLSGPGRDSARLPQLWLSDPSRRVHRKRVLQVLVLVALLILAVVTAMTVGGPLFDHRRPALGSISLAPAGSISATVFDPILLALPNSKLLVAGTMNDGSLAHILDLTTHTSTPIRVASSQLDVRQMFLLTDGRVLLLSWETRMPAQPDRSVAWLLDPDAENAIRAGDMRENHFGGAAAQLPDGSVVVSAGTEGPDSEVFVASVEMFDPGTGTFSTLPAMSPPRADHGMIALDDGRLLLVGGITSLTDGVAPRSLDAVLFDPASGSTTPVGKLGSDRYSGWRKLVRLSSGKVLIPGFTIGGQKCGLHSIDPAYAYLFDPTRAVLAEGPPLPHIASVVVPLPDGRAVLAGSWHAIPGGCSNVGTSQVADRWVGVYDPATGAVVESENPITGVGGIAGDVNRSYLAGALLPDGTVALIAESGEDQAPNAVDLLVVPH